MFELPYTQIYVWKNMMILSTGLDDGIKQEQRKNVWSPMNSTDIVEDDTRYLYLYDSTEKGKVKA